MSPRSRLATLLGARLIALESMLDPHELDKVPLIEAEEGAAPEFTARFLPPLISQQRPHPFFANRSYVVGGPAGGVVVLSRGRGSFFFIGFREDLLDLAELQDFDRINSYAAAVASIFKRVRCTLPKREHSARVRTATRSRAIPWCDRLGVSEREGRDYLRERTLASGRPSRERHTSYCFY